MDADNFDRCPVASNRNVVDRIPGFLAEEGTCADLALDESPTGIAAARDISAYRRRD